MLYSGLIAWIKLSEEGVAVSEETDAQEIIFVESLAWFPGWFVLTVALLFAIQRVRFGRRPRESFDAV